MGKYFEISQQTLDMLLCFSLISEKQDMNLVPLPACSVSSLLLGTPELVAGEGKIKTQNPTRQGPRETPGALMVFSASFSHTYACEIRRQVHSS